MVFIQLIRFQLEMTLKFLSLVPGPTGKAALDYVLTEWCARQNEFFGAYERKTRLSCSILASTLFFSFGDNVCHCVLKQDLGPVNS